MSNSEMISYIVGIGGLMLAFLGWMRNSKGDSSSTARWMGTIDQMLKEMSKKLDKLDALDGVPSRLEALERKFDQHLEEHRR